MIFFCVLFFSRTNQTGIDEHKRQYNNIIIPVPIRVGAGGLAAEVGGDPDVGGPGIKNDVHRGLFLQMALLRILREKLLGNELHRVIGARQTTLGQLGCCVSASLPLMTCCKGGIFCSGFLI